MMFLTNEKKMLKGLWKSWGILHFTMHHTKMFHYSQLLSPQEKAILGSIKATLQQIFKFQGISLKKRGEDQSEMNGLTDKLIEGLQYFHFPVPIQQKTRNDQQGHQSGHKNPPRENKGQREGFVKQHVHFLQQSIKSQVNNEQQQQKNLRQQCDDLHQQYENLRQQHKDLHQQHNDVQQQLKDLQQNYAIIQRQQAQEHQQYLELQQQHNTTQQKLKFLHEDLQKNRPKQQEEPENSIEVTQKPHGNVV